MSTGGPDLFVVCKNCGSEVSPYITECPYCGNRLRKRAPKLDRDGRAAERKPRARRRRRCRRLRRGRDPRDPRRDRVPYATIVLVLAGFVGLRCCGGPRSSAARTRSQLWAQSGTHLWWRLFTAPFTYDNTGYAFVALGAIALYGWLLERRHGPLLVLDRCS